MNTSTINPCDPDATAQISTQLAGLVMDTYDLTGFSHELRVMRLSALLTIYRATLELGDLEHTADWDWRITITTNDGSLIPDEHRAETTMCDAVELPYTVEPGDYTSAFERWEVLNVEVYDWSEPPTTTIVPVRIDDIRSITIEQA